MNFQSKWKASQPIIQWIRRKKIPERKDSSLNHRNIILPNNIKLNSLWPGPIVCLLLRVSSDYAQPITGQVTEVTCPVIGQAQPEFTPSKRQKTGLGDARWHCRTWSSLVQIMACHWHQAITCTTNDFSLTGALWKIFIAGTCIFKVQTSSIRKSFWYKQHWGNFIQRPMNPSRALTHPVNCFNIKTPPHQYRDSHHKIRVWWPCCLCNGNPYTRKESLYTEIIPSLLSNHSQKKSLSHKLNHCDKGAASI